MHDFLLCTHRKIRPVRTMCVVKISGTQTVFGLVRIQIKKNQTLKLSQNGYFSASFVWLLCQSKSSYNCQSKSSYNINAAFECSILHIMQYIMYTIYVLSVDKSFTKGLFMNLMVVCHFGLLNRHFASISGLIFQFKT